MIDLFRNTHASTGSHKLFPFRLSVTIVFVAALVFNTACNPVYESTVTRDDRAKWKVIETTTPQESQIELESSILPDGKLSIELRQQAMSILTKAAKGPRRVIIERSTGNKSLEKKWSWVGFSVGLVVLGLGAFMMADAHNHPPRYPDNGPENEGYTEGDAYGGGSFFSIMGSVMLGFGINGLARLRDTTISKRQAEEIMSRNEIKIGSPVPLKNQPLTITIDQTVVAILETDEQGRTILEASSIPIGSLVSKDRILASAEVISNGKHVGKLELDWAYQWHEAQAWESLQLNFTVEDIDSFNKRFPFTSHKDELARRRDCLNFARNLADCPIEPTDLNTLPLIDPMMATWLEEAGMKWPGRLITSDFWKGKKSSCKPLFVPAIQSLIEKCESSLADREEYLLSEWKREQLDKAGGLLKQNLFDEALSAVSEAVALFPDDKYVLVLEEKIESGKARAEARAEANVKKEAKREEARNEAERKRCLRLKAAYDKAYIPYLGCRNLGGDAYYCGAKFGWAIERYINSAYQCQPYVGE